MRTNGNEEVSVNKRVILDKQLEDLSYQNDPRNKPFRVRMVHKEVSTSGPSVVDDEYRRVASKKSYFLVEMFDGLDAMENERWIPVTPEYSQLAFSTIGESLLKLGVAYPKKCPITHRNFVTLLPSFGDPDVLVPTYGNKFESYTIPEEDHYGELTMDKYIHDKNKWVKNIQLDPSFSSSSELSAGISLLKEVNKICYALIGTSSGNPFCKEFYEIQDKLKQLGFSHN